MFVCVCFWIPPDYEVIVFGVNTKELIDKHLMLLIIIVNITKHIITNNGCSWAYVKFTERVWTHEFWNVEEAEQHRYIFFWICVLQQSGQITNGFYITCINDCRFVLYLLHRFNWRYCSQQVTWKLIRTFHHFLRSTHSCQVKSYDLV